MLTTPWTLILGQGQPERMRFPPSCLTVISSGLFRDMPPVLISMLPARMRWPSRPRYFGHERDAHVAAEFV